MEEVTISKIKGIVYKATAHSPIKVFPPTSAIGISEKTGKSIGRDLFRK